MVPSISECWSSIVWKLLNTSRGEKPKIGCCLMPSSIQTRGLPIWSTFWTMDTGKSFFLIPNLHIIEAILALISWSLRHCHHNLPRPKGKFSFLFWVTDARFDPLILVRSDIKLMKHLTFEEVRVMSGLPSCQSCLSFPNMIFILLWRTWTWLPTIVEIGRWPAKRSKQWQEVTKFSLHSSHDSHRFIICNSLISMKLSERNITPKWFAWRCQKKKKTNFLFMRRQHGTSTICTTWRSSWSFCSWSGTVSLNAPSVLLQHLRVLQQILVNQLINSDSVGSLQQWMRSNMDINLALIAATANHPCPSKLHAILISIVLTVAFAGSASSMDLSWNLAIDFCFICSMSCLLQQIGQFHSLQLLLVRVWSLPSSDSREETLGVINLILGFPLLKTPFWTKLMLQWNSRFSLFPQHHLIIYPHYCRHWLESDLGSIDRTSSPRNRTGEGVELTSTLVNRNNSVIIILIIFG